MRKRKPNGFDRLINEDYASWKDKKLKKEKKSLQNNSSEKKKLINKENK